MSKVSRTFLSRPCLAAAVAVSGLMLVSTPAMASTAATGTVRSAQGQAVPGSYVVVLRGSATETVTRGLATTYRGRITARWQAAIQGFSVQLSEDQAKRLAADPRVASVWQDSVTYGTNVQVNPPSWGLDRVDQRGPQLDGSFIHHTKAANVHAYVLDSGIRTTHATFGGRATWGADFVDGTNNDCHGHGTHVAGTLGGGDLGVAKSVSLVAVRITGCGNTGTVTQMINGIDWVTQNAIRPAVANMSVATAAFQPVDDAVNRLINSGVTFVAASGNNNRDACGSSPARVGAAITVNSVAANDVRAATSNFGSCTDIFAPGDQIVSSWNNSDTATMTLSGTSMAAPHVAGAAASWLARHPDDTPTQVTAAIVGAGTLGAVPNPGLGSPNRLLYTGAMADTVAAGPPDFNGDRRTDIALTGGAGWNFTPVAFSSGSGTFTVTDSASADFSLWAQTPGVVPVAGDFNADGMADTALIGGTGWSTIPVAFSRGDGTFTVTNQPANDFAIWAQVADIKVLAGDVNGDNRTDMTLLPGPNTPWWYTIPTAFANGDGTFTVVNTPSNDFAAWSQAPGARALMGDYNGDRRSDIVLLPGPNTPWWYTIPTAFSNGNGTFTITNTPSQDFIGWSQAYGARPVAGDYNADGRTDIVLLPGRDTPWWYTIPTAFSNGNGTFAITNTPSQDFASWSQAPGVRTITGDFNTDGRTDIVLLPGPNTPWWFTIPVAFSNGNGTFAITNTPSQDFASWSQAPGARTITGDFNADSRTDIALLNGPNTPWWFTIPVAFSTGNGTFTITNTPSNDLTQWAETPGARVIAKSGL